ncbi:MAG: adenylyl-sulfate reductase subunit beta [SAR324 cluster bacterium]|nr:adenylyl-sulfate reductase subunit beta [SAR324 cluster bacterium]
MPSFVITEKCDGCMGQEKTACMYVCPHDLMALNPDTRKAFNQEAEQCWECYCCVKICPQQVIEIRCYADFAPLGGSVIPLMASDSILWTIKFRNGNIKRFKFPIRTTIPGQVDKYSENITVDMSKIKEPGLYSHQARGDVLPVPTEAIPAA